MFVQAFFLCMKVYKKAVLSQETTA